MRGSLWVSGGAALLLVATLVHVTVTFEPQLPRASSVPVEFPPAAKATRLGDAEVLEQLISLSGLDDGYLTHATFEFERVRRISWSLEGVVLQNGVPMEVVATATFDPDDLARFTFSKTGASALPKGAPPGSEIVEILLRASAPPSLVEAAGPGNRILMIYDHARGPPYTTTEVPAYTIADGRLASIENEKVTAPVLRLVALQDRGLHGFHGEERAIVSLGTN